MPKTLSPCWSCSLPMSGLKAAIIYLSSSRRVTIGLFDAALNYMWDETIQNLRTKVVNFDLGYFYDSVLDAQRRPSFSTEDDLKRLDDWEFIKGCRHTGLIGDLGLSHLDYIRNMRNFASAAHPNQNQITGLQLITWLQTCILEVLGREPEGAALEVRYLLNNIRNVISRPRTPTRLSRPFKRSPVTLRTRS